jgi:hypothetical protein
VRLPVDKIYRAVPELDAFSDEQCEAFVRRARTDHRWSMFAWVFLAVVAGVVCGLVWLVGGAASVAALHRAGVARSDSMLFPLVLLVGAAVFPAGTGLWVRDRSLRRAIARSIAGARCGGCGYSLLGLTPDAGGNVQCPECGLSINLAEYKLTEEHLMGKAAISDQ